MQSKCLGAEFNFCQGKVVAYITESPRISLQRQVPFELLPAQYLERLSVLLGPPGVRDNGILLVRRN